MSAHRHDCLWRKGNEELESRNPKNTRYLLSKPQEGHRNSTKTLPRSTFAFSLAARLLQATTTQPPNQTTSKRARGGQRTAYPTLRFMENRVARPRMHRDHERGGDG